MFHYVNTEPKMGAKYLIKDYFHHILHKSSAVFCPSLNIYLYIYSFIYLLSKVDLSIYKEQSIFICKLIKINWEFLESKRLEKSIRLQHNVIRRCRGILKSFRFIKWNLKSKNRKEGIQFSHSITLIWCFIKVKITTLKTKEGVEGKGH